MGRAPPAGGGSGAALEKCVPAEADAAGPHRPTRPGGGLWARGNSPDGSHSRLARRQRHRDGPRRHLPVCAVGEPSQRACGGRGGKLLARPLAGCESRFPHRDLGNDGAAVARHRLRGVGLPPGTGRCNCRVEAHTRHDRGRRAGLAGGTAAAARHRGRRAGISPCNGAQSAWWSDTRTVQCCSSMAALPGSGAVSSSRSSEPCRAKGWRRRWRRPARPHKARRRSR